MLGGNLAYIARKSGWEIFTPSSRELDLRNPKTTLDFLSDFRIDSVIHCAARVGGIATNIAHPADFILDNLQIDTSLISASRKVKIPEFIYFGSSCMYPRETSQPLEIRQILSSKLEPTNEDYAIAKISGAKSVTSVAKQDGLNWKVLIPSNLYGPRDNFDLETAHLVPAVIRKIFEAVENKRTIIEIWGDGNARREFTYVEDVSGFVIEKFDSLHNWPSMMNIGYGTDFTVTEYYEMIAIELGYSGKFEYNLRKPDGMPRKLLNSEVAKGFGWSPATDIKLGIKKTIQWFKENVANE